MATKIPDWWTEDMVRERINVEAELATRIIEAFACRGMDSLNSAEVVTYRKALAAMAAYLTHEVTVQ